HQPGPPPPARFGVRDQRHVERRRSPDRKDHGPNERAQRRAEGRARRRPARGRAVDHERDRDSRGERRAHAHPRRRHRDRENAEERGKDHHEGDGKPHGFAPRTSALHHPSSRKSYALAGETLPEPRKTERNRPRRARRWWATVWQLSDYRSPRWRSSTPSSNG